MMMSGIDLHQNSTLLLREAIRSVAPTAFHQSVMVQNSRSLSNPDMPCDPFTSQYFPYICYNFGNPISVDPEVPELIAIQPCFTANITEPLDSRSNQECGSICFLSTADGASLCSYCAFLENGEFVYDCTNLYPSASCPARNSDGNCVEEFDQWTCVQTPEFGQRWFCPLDNGSNPASLRDDMSEMDVTTSLVCSNDMSGQDPVACQDPTCIIADANNSTNRCSTCALLESGEFVYDCRNLYPNTPCPARNSDGKCVGGFGQWSCIQSPELAPVIGRAGWLCLFNGPNPAFPHDDISQSEVATTLICSNDISGLDATACRDPICTITNTLTISQDNTVADLTEGARGNISDWIATSNEVQSSNCASCKVVHQDNISETRPIFEYDCLSAVKDLKCPILLANGECRFEPLETPPEPENTTLWNVPSFLLADEQKEDDLEPGWTLNNIDATTFNVLTDVFDKIVMMFFTAAVGIIYPVFLSLQLRRGKKAVEASALGHVPSDFLSALQSFKGWNLSLPGVVLLSLVFISDFAHSIADFGLDFVAVKQKGPDRTVMLLGAEPQHRNPFPPPELSGDPITSRTLYINKLIKEKNFEASRPETAVINEVLNAVDLAARGGSPFFRKNRTSWRMVDTSYSNADSNFLSFYVDYDENPLIEIDMEIPLECYDVEMVKSTRVSTGVAFYDAPREIQSWVPNCILTAVRSTGIFGGQRMDVPEIIETLEIIDPIYVTDQGKSIWLTKGNESFVSFQASPESKALARDRNETEGAVRGRRFYDVDGMQVGTTYVGFSSVFLASGRPLLDLFNRDKSRQEYGLIAEVEGGCPSRPSGLDKGGEVCLVFIVLHCDAFPEDTALIVHDKYGPELESSSCDFSEFTIAWGRNFKADEELAATVAGLYGMTKPSVSDSSKRPFEQHSILAALFALGQVREAPSIEEVVRPRVNMLFIMFMLFPLILSVALLIISIRIKRYSDLPTVPTEAWELLILGAENKEALPERPDSHAPFPEVDKKIVFAAFLDDDDGSSVGSSAGGNSVQGRRGRIIYAIDTKNKDQSLRSWTLSTRASSIVITPGICQALQQSNNQDSDSSSDDGTNSKHSSSSSVGGP